MRTRLLSPGFLGALVLAGCGASSDDSARRAAPPAAAPTPAQIPAHVAHKDPRVDRPSFVWITPRGLPRFTGARAAATATLAGISKVLELDAAALSALGAPVIHDPGEGSIVARFHQRVSGVEVFRGDLSLLFTRDLEPIAASGVVAGDVSGAAAPFVLSPGDAAREAYSRATGRRVDLTLVDRASGEDRFFAPDLDQPARVKKVLYPKRRGQGDTLEPAYRVEVVTKGGGAWSFVVSALSGEILFQNDLLRYEAYSYRVFASPDSLLPFDGPQGNALAPHPTGRPDGTRPTWQASQLVTLESFPFSKNDPWLPPGATRSQGNNVDAYADLASPDGYYAASGDVVASPSAAGVFDHVYATDQAPDASNEQIQASVTQLFYATNFLHDWFYDAGFDEKSGNPQADNFGRGGRDNDRLLVEAQDYSGRNNANAMTPADGASPRIQMFVFSGTSEASLVVSSPAAIAGDKTVGIAGFGTDAFDLTGQVVLADDELGIDPHDACEPLARPVAGKIVLAHRGTCTFVEKAQNVQAAGGVGLVVANLPSSSDPSVPPFMGGTSAEITIPALSLSLADGKALEGALSEVVTVTMKRALQTDLDGALDTSIVAHEWAHVLTNRLVGNADGLTTNQAGGLGEGWSDFVSLLLTAREDDVETASGANWAGAYATGAYATSGGGADFYFGIRRVPYSVDFTKNALTFRHVQNGVALPSTAKTSFGEDGSFNAQVHATGEVWATMLWECYVSLLRDPRYGFQAAQDRMKRYLVTSLKVTPPDPTLLEARDALLAAAYATDEADFLAFWNAFARRGAGVSAVGPGKESADNRGVEESFVVGNDVQIVEVKLRDDVITCDRDDILDPGEVGSIEVTVRNAGSGSLEATSAQLSATAPGMSFDEGGAVTFPSLRPFETATVRIETQMAFGEPIVPFEVDVSVTDPTLAVPRTVRVSAPARFDTDETPDSSAKDTVDTTKTAWSVASVDRYRMSREWSRTAEGSNGWWTIPNVAVPTDHTLTSPEFVVSGTSFGLSFKHRWSFRTSLRRGDVDGGVIEISTDGGKRWRDLERLGTVDYNTTLAQGRGDNVLAGRRAYGNESKRYPEQWVTSKIDVRLPEPAAKVQLRFRMGTGLGFAGAAGWDIDDIELTGIAGTPFWSFQPHADECDPDSPWTWAGEPRTVPSRTAVTLEGAGEHPKALPMTFVWSQTEGPRVSLETDGSPRLSFEAPEVTEPTTLRFALRAHDGTLVGPASNVDVTVTPRLDRISALGGGCASIPGRSTSGDLVLVGLGALGAALARRRRERS
jgi:large repetitive protein